MQVISPVIMARQNIYVQRKMEHWWYEKHGRDVTVFPQFSEEDMRGYLLTLGIENVYANSFEALFEVCVTETLYKKFY